MEKWTEHLRRLQRFTVADRKLRAQMVSFHLGSNSPLVRRLIGTGSPLP
ncbi:MFS transporter [Azohydromonas australica]